MKHLKKLLPIILTASLLCGCGDTNNAPESPDAVVSGGLSQAAGTDSASSTESSADSGITVSDNAASSGSSEAEELPQGLIPETEEVIELLATYGDFITMHTFPIDPTNAQFSFVDKTVSVKVKITYDGTSFVKTIVPNTEDTDDGYLYYKAKDEWLNSFNALATENLKQQLLQESEPIVEFEGDIYIERLGAGGYGEGIDYLYLNSIENIDENTIACVVTMVRAPYDEWAPEYVTIKNDVVTVKRTDNGLRVDGCGLKAAEYFSHCREIRYGDRTFPL